MSDVETTLKSDDPRPRDVGGQGSAEMGMSVIIPPGGQPQTWDEYQAGQAQQQANDQEAADFHKGQDEIRIRAARLQRGEIGDGEQADLSAFDADLAQRRTEALARNENEENRLWTEGQHLPGADINYPRNLALNPPETFKFQANSEGGIDAFLDAHEPTPAQVDAALDAHDMPQDPGAGLTDEEIEAQTEPVELAPDDVPAAEASSTPELRALLVAD